ncbi:hypothetical protein N7492_001513 [Penicillium capsulatum]|uniref:Peptidase S8/S53 domain-containing protein n=1 Tax=Penicillium capsulatum TaxID=69766 RepID=A0A9W9ITY3_9EURO|nr:hypothetical protein N7492_001513 [Penicillium capsulatum]KAJ6129434.1 hypothetical protein N7512_002214 [Penicillium capsulatum]
MPFFSQFCFLVYIQVLIGNVACEYFSEPSWSFTRPSIEKKTRGLTGVFQPPRIESRNFLNEDTEAPHLAFISNSRPGNPSPPKFKRDESEGQGTTIFILDQSFKIDLPELAKNDREINTHFVEVSEIPNMKVVPASLLGDPQYFSHGTTVAALAAGVTLGPAPKANLELVKISGEYEQEDGKLAPFSVRTMWEDGFDYVLRRVTELKQAGRTKFVVNISMFMRKDESNPERTQAMEPAIRNFFGRLQEDGIVVVLAGGNTGLEKNDQGETDTYEDYFLLYIASEYDNVITVGGLDTDGTLWPGTTPRTLCANDGADIYAPAWDVRTILKTGEYTKSAFFGTSLSAPIVAGTLAYFLGIDPLDPPDEYKSLPGKIYSEGKVNAAGLVEYMKDISHKSKRVLREGTEELPYEPPVELRVLYNGAQGPGVDL